MTARPTLPELRVRAAALRDVLTEVALSWGRRAGLEEAQTAVFDAMRLVGAWCAIDPDDVRFLAQLDEAASRLDEAALPVGDADVELLGEARTELGFVRAAALEELASQRGVPLRAPSTHASEVARPFLASGGVTALHTFPVPRPELLGTEAEQEETDDLDAAFDEQDDEDDDEDGDEDDPLEMLRGFGVELPPELSSPRARAAAAAIPDSSVVGALEKTVHALGRGGLEELAGLYPLVDVLEDAPWAEAEHAQARVGITLDALVALATPRAIGVPAFDLPRRAMSYASEWAVPDAGRTFALVFPLASCDAAAALDWIHFSFQRSHPRTHGAFVRALALATHPGVNLAVEDWLATEVDSERLATLLRVAARRCLALRPASALLLAHPDERVATAAAEAIVRAPRELAEAALDEVMSEWSPPDLAVAAARGLLRLGATRALDFLRPRIEPWLRGGHERAARAALACIALAGDRRDEDQLLAWTALVPRSTRLLGFFGAVGHLGPLVSRLQAAQDVEDRGDARESLHRISGLGHAVRRLDEAGPAASAEDLAPVRWPPHEVPARALEGTLEGWRRAAQASSAAQPAGSMRRRARFGSPHAPLAILEELADERTPQSARRLLALELEIAMAAPLAFDLDGWVVRQRTAISALAEELRAAQGIAARGSPSAAPPRGTPRAT